MIPDIFNYGMAKPTDADEEIRFTFDGESFLHQRSYLCSDLLQG